MSAAAIRTAQEKDALGHFFHSLYQFTDRTMQRFFREVPGMVEAGAPALSFDTSLKGRACYAPPSPAQPWHAITMNPNRFKDGRDLSTSLAHELVHMAEHFLGTTMDSGFHGTAFHTRMATMGIVTEGRNGAFKGFGTVDGEPVLDVWLMENADLGIEEFLLPGKAEPRRRPLYRYGCQCGTTLRTRKPNLCATCDDCETPFVKKVA